MKKITAIIFLMFLLTNCSGFCEDDLWDNFGDSNIYGQKAVSDEEFERAVNSKQKKPKKNKDVPKGESFSQSNETELLKKSDNDVQILLIPLPLKVKEGYTIPIGHYEIEGIKEDDGEVYIKLYQAHDLIAKIPAEETDDDFGEDNINFVKLQSHGDYHVEILYGSMDFNAYAIIDIE